MGTASITGPRSGRAVGSWTGSRRSTVLAGIRAGEAACPPSHSRRNSGWLDRPRGALLFLREMAGTRDVRLPLRGQRRLAHRLWGGAPCFPFNCRWCCGHQDGSEFTVKYPPSRQKTGKDGQSCCALAAACGLQRDCASVWRTGAIDMMG
ncbi:hypothetical protein ACS15_2645 [Ralstonia insidiosa]|uniref:Uncharacterized protein n=1 Tax=Ralstonia insidiosa TaxID=190721 RepID=A0AAC9BEQ3_9RALS|nr:hypothetical protein ACS15_2645 [Ralstonia insidiosa]